MTQNDGPLRIEPPKARSWPSHTTHTGRAGVTDVGSYQAYARPNTTPRIKKEKYTLCAEWTMMPIQVLRKRQLGNAYRKTPLMTDARIPQGW